MPQRTTRQRPQQFLALPSQGGVLKSRHAETDIGLANYLVKHNFRRDLDKELRREGCEYFAPQPTTTDEEGKAQAFPTNQPITLIHNLRRPDGTVGLIVGTETTFYRYHGGVGGPYVELVNPDDGDTYWVDGYTDDDVSGYWSVIADGFAKRSEGALRWGAANANGWALFSNGYNPPVMYRLEWDEVRTIPDLLVQGITTLKCVTEFNSMAFWGNVGEIPVAEAKKLFEAEMTSVAIEQPGYVFSLDRQPNVLLASAIPQDASKGIFLVAATEDVFGNEDDGRVIRTEDGRYFHTITYKNDKEIFVQEIKSASKALSDRYVANGAGWDVASKLDGVDKEPKIFWLTNFFDEDAKRNIDQNSYVAGVRSTPPNGKSPFAFPADTSGKAYWEGKLLGFADGSVRRIVEWLDENMVRVDSDRPVKAVEKASITNTAWSDYTQAPPVVDQRHYRVLWSNLTRPDQYGKTIEATASSGSDVLNSRLDLSGLYSAGQSVVVQGAGPAGGILVAKVVEAGPGVLKIDRSAVMSGDVLIFDSPLLNSVAGYEDLQDQGSGVLAAKALMDRLVIYKDASIFVATYTGDPDRPLLFKRLAVSHGHTLHYRHTLATVTNRLHVYVSREGFFSFDLANGRPVRIGAADDMQNVFFRQIHDKNREDVYAVDNNPTEELWVTDASPDAPRTLLTTERTICYDYRYNTFSTTDMAPTAASTIIDPANPKPLGETEHMFLLGYATGGLHLYGKIRTNKEVFDRLQTPDKDDDGNTYEVEGSYRIYYRRSEATYDLSKFEPYKSELRSGLDNFLWPMFEKRLGRYDLSFAPITQDDVEVTVNLSFRFARSLRDSKEQELGPVPLPIFERQMLPIHHQAYRVGDLLSIDGIDNPCALVSRSFDYHIVESRNALRTLSAP
jgi:hypothetical protein